MPIVDLLEELQEAIKDLEEQKAANEKRQKEMQFKMRGKRRKR